MNLSEDTEDSLKRPQGRFKCLLMLNFILILSFCSCNKKNSKINNQETLSRQLINDFKIKEARYSDIPVPLGYSCVVAKNDQRLDINVKDASSSDCIYYAGNLPQDELIDYYCSSMEQFGWEIINLSNGHEGLLFCNKPRRYCVVSIRNNDVLAKQHSKNNVVYLFIKNKKIGEETKQTKDINAKMVSLDNIFN